MATWYRQNEGCSDDPQEADYCSDLQDTPQPLNSDFSLNNLNINDHHGGPSASGRLAAPEEETHICPSASHQNGPDINGEYRLRNPPGRLNVSEEESFTNNTLGMSTSTTEEVSNFFETNIMALSRLIAEVCKLSNRPTEVAQNPLQRRSPKELRIELQLKMEQLKRVVEGLSSNESFNDLTVHELYYVIREVSDKHWKHLMRCLEVTDVEMEACERLYTDDILEKKYQMLQIWLRKDAGVLKNYRDQLIYVLGLINYGQLASLFKKSTLSAPP
ncbi:uncharacterized protein [Dendropsophus ebraccatus]|uniref:uncharacterized protein isoform X2 n=1 Tax=Dendropsophus ebraccatus TaxID=150705 RepID=UPI00383151E6